MDKTILNSLRTLSLVLLFSAMNNASAHHSVTATFKDDSEISVEGVVTEFSFRNPHVIIYLDVTDEDGAVTNWMAEGSAATGWRRNGWANDTVEPGDRMRITGDSTHDGSPMVWISDMLMVNADGSAYAPLSSPENSERALAAASNNQEQEAGELYTIPLTLPTGEPNFTGITMQNMDIRPGVRRGPDGNDPEVPYNEVGKAALEAFDLTTDPQVFCDPPGLVRQAGYTSYGLKINQYPDHVTIEYEEFGGKRAVFFADELPKPGPRSRMGDSVARYEGDSLVIETVNLLPNLSGHRGNPLSENARVTEVYSHYHERSDLGVVLEIATTVVDPTYLTEPWTIQRYSLYTDNYEYIENDCQSPLRERPENAYQYSDFDLQFVD